MSEIKHKKGLFGFESILKEKAQELVVAVDAGNLKSASNLINELQHFKHDAFYNEVGYLTRGMHDAIKSFSEDVPLDEVHKGDESDESIRGIADASDRLNYVIELTEKTSHETMDRVDKTLALTEKMDEQSSRFQDLLSLVGQLEAEHASLRGVYDRTCQLKEESEATVAHMRAELQEILVAQSYQDISGQLIRRVITLVTHVEESLVQLMGMAANVELISGLETESAADKDEEKPEKKDGSKMLEGPQINQDSNPNVACSQDDVDELLSSLGF